VAYSVPRGIVSDAKLCPHGYVCLSEEGGNLRQAERLVPGNGVFVPGHAEVDCPYAEKCEGGVSCSCPVRIQLFKQYGL
jgi:hypothetical protein